MNSLYQLAGMSKQAHFKAMQTAAQRQQEADRIVEQGRQLRAQHPVMGCRKLYHLMAPDLNIGRDKTEALLLANGFRVRYPRNFIRTTYSVTSRYFDNLISGKKIDGIDQIWQTDITYFITSGVVYYLIFIVDVYSKRILAHQANTHMRATANIKALQQAIQCRGNRLDSSLIHHSDRGGQFIDEDYKALQKDKEITPSMGKYSWENAYAERVNGIIKNEYLHHWHNPNLRTLRRNLATAVNLYNEKRPHLSLPDKTPPMVFESNLAGDEQWRYEMTIYDSTLSTDTTVFNKEKRTKKER